MSHYRFTTILITFFLGIGCSVSTKVPTEQIVLNTMGPISIKVDSFGGDVTITADESNSNTVVTLEKRIVQELDLEDLSKWITCTTAARSTKRWLFKLLQ